MGFGDVVMPKGHLTANNHRFDANDRQRCNARPSDDYPARKSFLCQELVEGHSSPGPANLNFTDCFKSRLALSMSAWQR